MYTIHINTNTILIGIHNGLKIHNQLHVATTPTPANLRVRNIKHNIVPIPNPLLFLFSAMSLSYLVQRILMLLLLTQPGKPFARTAPV